MSEKLSRRAWLAGLAAACAGIVAFAPSLRQRVREFMSRNKEGRNWGLGTELRVFIDGRQVELLEFTRDITQLSTTLTLRARPGAISVRCGERYTVQVFQGNRCHAGQFKGTSERSDGREVVITMGGEFTSIDGDSWGRS